MFSSQGAPVLGLHVNCPIRTDLEVFEAISHGLVESIAELFVIFLKHGTFHFVAVLLVELEIAEFFDDFAILQTQK